MRLVKVVAFASLVALVACVEPLPPANNVCNGEPDPPAFQVVYNAGADTTAVISNRWPVPARSADTIRFPEGNVVLGWSTFNPDKCRSLMDSMWTYGTMPEKLGLIKHR